jgi:hypothetical protein
MERGERLGLGVGEAELLEAKPPAAVHVGAERENAVVTRSKIVLLP